MRRCPPISIHALREEGDGCPFLLPAGRCYFYPRPPRGGRRKGHDLLLLGTHISIHALREEGDSAVSVIPAQFNAFLSTPSARRATYYPRTVDRSPSDFYPRPPRGGRPARSFLLWNSLTYFYPRPPRGGRPGAYNAQLEQYKFLSTPSARRATLWAWWENNSFTQFLSTPSARRATRAEYQRVHHLADFYPRPPRGGRRKKPP